MLKIGTHSSALAYWQGLFTQTALARVGVESELVAIETQGDKREDKFFFIKKLEEALLRGDVDVVPHSMKDLPTVPPPGLAITAVSRRDDPSDWLIIRPEAMDAGQMLRFRAGAVVGAPTHRRKAQLLDFRPDVQWKDVLGDTPTRLEQLRAGDFDAIFLAAASVLWLALDVSGLEIVRFSPREFVPAAAQGVLAWQTNRDDLPTRQILKKIHCPDVSAVTNIERRVLQMLESDSQLSLGVHCERDDAGNFHCFAACQMGAALRRAQISQSTSAGLAERIVRALKA